MKPEQTDHTFVVPAYGYSEHLGSCLRTLAEQTVPSRIVVSSSTPSDGLASICSEFGVELRVHSPNRGIAHDWNSALAQARTRYVTLAHQDDLYYPAFTARTLAALSRSRTPLLAFTGYEEFTEAGPRPPSKLLLIKRVLLELGFLGRSRVTSRFAKVNCLRFACPIPCPSVTLNTQAYRSGFDGGYQVNLDWATWLAAATCEGDFVWVRETLMGHRIHPASETSAAIHDGRRAAEDFHILSQMWPAAMAKLIVRAYKLAYASNQE